MPGTTSILIISYNRPNDLLELLQSLARQEDLSALEETLVLNNASTESYVAIQAFASAHPELKLRYISSTENLGVSRGRNRLMQEARGEYLLVLDDDIVFEATNSFAYMAHALDDEYYQSQRTAILTFRVLYFENRQPQVTAFPHKQFEKLKDEPRFLTYYFTGCCHLIRKSALAETGLYPTDFFYGMEEYDLSYRMIAKGYSLAYDAGATVLHKESPLGRQPNHQKLASQWVNKSKVAWRYLPARYFFSTAIAWSLQYLRQAFTRPADFLKGLGRIVQIPFKEKRQKLNTASLRYLRQVQARLWY
jgi:GT2 family glycosyltransferase